MAWRCLILGGWDFCDIYDNNNSSVNHHDNNKDNDNHDNDNDNDNNDNNDDNK